MKKPISLVGMGLLFVSLVMMSCAPVQKTMLTKNSAPMLKGNWQGWTTFSVVPSKPILTTLQITNNAFPVEGNITLINLPGEIAAIFPADAKTAGGDVMINFIPGMMITDQGTLLGRSGENFLELTYYTGEKPKLDGWFYYYYAKGTVELTKK
jgi:hypothetical protein